AQGHVTPPIVTAPAYPPNTVKRDKVMLEKFNMGPWMTYVKLSLRGEKAEDAILMPLDAGDPRNEVACHYITTSVPTDLRTPILGMTVAYRMMEALKAEYEKPDYDQQQVIEKELRSIRLSKNDAESVKKTLETVEMK